MKRELFDSANAVLFTLAALLPIVNPLGSAPIFLSMTADLPGPGAAQAGDAVARHAFLLLTAAMLIGTLRAADLRRVAADRPRRRRPAGDRQRLAPAERR